MKKIRTKIKSAIKGINQRLYYIKNFKKGFSLIFLLPGSIRESIGDNTFFKTLIKKNKNINLEKFGEFSLLTAGKFKLKFPKGCFYEGDFFDIIYPSLGLKDPLIDALVYDNPFYVSEGCYENFGTTLKDGDYVVDAGANIGMFSVIASNAVGRGGKVFAFEPLKEISAILKENITENNCENITVVNDLLGDSNKSVKFFCDLENNYNGSSTVIQKENTKTLKLNQITLDDFVQKNSIQKIDFIKADIEGAERDLLRGAEQTIKKFKPKLSIRTYHLPDDPEVLYNLIKKYVPEYKTMHYKKTLYAWI